MTKQDFTELPKKIQNLVNELKFKFNGEIRKVKRKDIAEDDDKLHFINLELETNKVVMTSSLEGEIKWIQPLDGKNLVIEYKDTNGIKWDITLNGVVTT